MYSGHCSGCKKFGPIYERLAGLHKDDPEIGFSRLNSDKNSMKEGFNFNYTPVCLYFKKGVKTPFEYRRMYLTLSLLRDFVDVCKEVKLIDDRAILDEI